MHSSMKWSRSVFLFWIALYTSLSWNKMIKLSKYAYIEIPGILYLANSGHLFIRSLFCSYFGLGACWFDMKKVFFEIFIVLFIIYCPHMENWHLSIRKYFFLFESRLFYSYIICLRECISHLFLRIFEWWFPPWISIFFWLPQPPMSLTWMINIVRLDWLENHLTECHTLSASHTQRIKIAQPSKLGAFNAPCDLIGTRSFNIKIIMWHSLSCFNIWGA